MSDTIIESTANFLGLKKFDTIIESIANLLGLKKPEYKKETVKINTVYNVRDVLINGKGCYIVLYFEGDTIKTLVENHQALHGNIVHIQCVKIKEEQGLLKHTTTTTEITPELPDIKWITHEYCLYLPDNMTIKGTLKD
jgi:hypothetical protein